MVKRPLSRFPSGPSIRFLLAMLVCCGFFAAADGQNGTDACDELCSDWGELIVNNMYITRTLVFRYAGPEKGSLEIGASPGRQRSSSKSIRLKPGIYYSTKLMREAVALGNVVVVEEGEWMETNVFEIRIGKTTTINNIPDRQE